MIVLTRLWIVLSAWLVGTGWILSVFHELNRAGYLVCFALLAAGFFWRLSIPSEPPRPVTQWCRKFWRRFKRPMPLLFLLIVLLNLAGGLVSRPNNGDTNAYRTPRVLHWLGSGGWHWIHTGDFRMNVAGAGYEWLFAPLILFTRSDRWIFLPNLFAYLLLPGLIFCVFRRLGIGRRVAWWWMWILASGWCYALQACSTLADGIGVIYALAAVDFALRARESQRSGDVWFSMLAAGLLTGVKQTNLPLLLPWAVAIWPVARLLLKKPAVSLAIILSSLLISAAPMACLNWAHTGSWVGIPKTGDGENWAWDRQQELTSPLWGIAGNIFCLSAQNLLPPFFPQASAWNNAMLRFLQTPLGTHFTQFEVFGHLGRSVSETTAGIGLGIAVLTLASILAAGRQRHLPVPDEKQTANWYLRLLCLAPWMSLLVFMAKVGSYQNARYLAPYYVLLLPAILADARQVQLTRRRWWRWAALLVLMITAAYLCFVRGRDLLPADMMLRLHEKHPHIKIFLIMNDHFDAQASVEAQRNHFKQDLPPGEKILGYATVSGGAEPGLWMPFGQRTVKRILPEDTPAELLKEGIHYIVVEDVVLNGASQTIDQWIASYHGLLVDQLTFTRDPGSPPGHLYLVRLNE